MRLDQLLVERGLFASREKARRAVMAGEVEVDGRRVEKAGTAVDKAADLLIKRRRPPFVSRAGGKLEFALETFEVQPNGWVCLDVGASTGGFTDCLLQRGAKRVYAVDVGYGQLDQSLREDSRVVVMERTNARYLAPSDLPELCDLAVMDLSFISLLKVVPAVLPLLRERGYLLPLIKPQFEVGKGRVGKGGVVRDEDLRRRTVQERVDEIVSMGTKLEGIVDSAIVGVKGNRESLALFRKLP